MTGTKMLSTILTKNKKKIENYTQKLFPEHLIL